MPLSAQYSVLLMNSDGRQAPALALGKVSFGAIHSGVQQRIVRSDQPSDRIRWGRQCPRDTPCGWGAKRISEVCKTRAYGSRFGFRRKSLSTRSTHALTSYYFACDSLIVLRYIRCFPRVALTAIVLIPDWRRRRPGDSGWAA